MQELQNPMLIPLKPYDPRSKSHLVILCLVLGRLLLKDDLQFCCPTLRMSKVGNSSQR